MNVMNVGSKEIISFELVDRLDNVTTLDGVNVEQKITTEDEATVKQDWTTSLSTEDMRVDCLVDTTSWDEGTYKLYVRVNIPPELPILGPFLFEVS